jgi:hypothetical protein
MNKLTITVANNTEEGNTAGGPPLTPRKADKQAITNPTSKFEANSQLCKKKCVFHLIKKCYTKE